MKSRLKFPIWLVALFVLCLTGVLSANAQTPAEAPAVDPVQLALRQKEIEYTYYAAAIYLLVAWVGMVLAGLGILDYYLKKSYGFGFIDILPLPKIDFRVEALWKASGASKDVKPDQPLDHSYDGIVELDNAAPPLFNYILYGTMIFAVVYWYYYHVAEVAPLQKAEYETAMTVAQQAKDEYRRKAANLVDENNVEVLKEAGEIAEGKTIFADNCAACHGAAGEGKVGPNFTDEYWLHGGGIKNVFKTIKYGVPDKGMRPWGSELSPAQINQVASFILTLKGTNPPNQKEAQGEIWSEGGAASGAITAKTDTTVATADTSKTQ